jgi:hypothetical protein
MRSPVIGLLIALGLPLAAGAASPDWAEIDPEPLIDRCWSISQEDRDSGVTVLMSQGAANTIDCLEEEIVRHATAFFKTKNEEEIRQLVSDLDKPYAEFYWVMYNENKGCEPSCGSMYHMFHVGALASLLENILRDLVSQRNYYER